MARRARGMARGFDQTLLCAPRQGLSPAIRRRVAERGEERVIQRRKMRAGRNGERWRETERRSVHSCDT